MRHLCGGEIKQALRRNRQAALSSFALDCIKIEAARLREIRNLNKSSAFRCSCSSKTQHTSMRLSYVRGAVVVTLLAVSQVALNGRQASAASPDEAGYEANEVQNKNPVSANANLVN